jgi:hypothetical protein
MKRARLALSLTGFLIAVVGIARNDRYLVWIAIGLLGASLAVRLVQKRQQRRDETDAGSGNPGP